MRAVLMLLLTLAVSCPLSAQDSPVFTMLQRRLIDPELPLKEVQEFTETRMPPMPDVKSVPEWESFAQSMRERTLNNVVLRGEAAAWSRLPTRVEYLDTIDAAPEYVIRKLRYEAVPGMWIPALLYEPKQLAGKVPVVLNVNGHDGKGKAADYKQIRCINQAKRGMLSLNLEWVGMGQLRSAGFGHYKMNQLDLCGTSGLAPFYLSMTRGLDVLLAHPHADAERVAVAGLSGGGWQTIFISSLDERVTLTNPVAGYSSFKTRARFQSDLGDSEQTPSDLGTETDYELLTALMAPRATLLTNNVNDLCCFKAAHAQPPLVDAAAPIFDLYDKSSWLRTHVNHDPGSHNFEKDNRQQLYKMIGDHFYGGLLPVLVRVDAAALRTHNLTPSDVRDALGGDARAWSETTDGLFADIVARLGRAPDPVPDFVVTLSRHFGGETIEALGERKIRRGDRVVRLADVASFEGVPSPNFDPAYNAEEIACDAEVKSFEELEVPLSEGNQDFHSLALSLLPSLPAEAALPASRESGADWTRSRRADLARVVSAQDWEVRALLEKEEQWGDLTFRFWWLRIGGLWTVPATECIPPGELGEVVLLCGDAGRAELSNEAAAEVQQGHRVIAFDPFYFGESKISQRDFLYGLLVAATGERNLGIQASQIGAIARWARDSLPETRVSVRVVGPRLSLAALVASGLETRAIDRLVVEQPYGSLKEIITGDLGVNQAPELFCFGLLKEFDVPQLVSLSGCAELETVGNTEAVRASLQALLEQADRVGPASIVVK